MGPRPRKTPAEAGAVDKGKKYPMLNIYPRRSVVGCERRRVMFLTVWAGEVSRHKK